MSGPLLFGDLIVEDGGWIYVGFASFVVLLILAGIILFVWNAS